MDKIDVEMAEDSLQDLVNRLSLSSDSATDSCHNRSKKKAEVIMSNDIHRITSEYTVCDVIIYTIDCCQKGDDVCKVIKQIHKLIQNADTTWLFTHDRVQDLVKIYNHFAETLCLKVKICTFVDKERSLDESDFVGVADIAKCVMDCFCELLKRLKKCEDQTFLNSILKSNSVKFTELIILNNEHNMWTDSKSVLSATRLKEIYFNTLNIKSMTEVLLLEHDQNSIFKGILDYNQSKLGREMWKNHPGNVEVFVRSLLHIKHLSDYIDRVLPPSLLFIEDFELHNKLKGVTCLNHIIMNTSAAEFSWYGRADVVYEALQRHLYTNEVTLIDVLHPCLLNVLKVLDRCQIKSTKVLPHPWGKYDDVFQIILTNMEMENRIVLRRANSSHLVQYIEQMGITVVRHYKRLWRVIFGYLEVYDGPEDQTRLNILNALASVIRNTWPRIPHHTSSIVKAILKLVYNITVSESMISPNSKEKILVQATECMALLKHASAAKLPELLNGLQGIDVNVECQLFIKNVLET